MVSTQAAPPSSICPTHELPRVAAELVAAALRQAMQRRGQAHIALSGGSTPRALFRLLAEPSWQDKIPWSHVHVWWADERCVPPDHFESNYAAAFTLLLSHLHVVQIHRMHGEDPHPAAAAQRYELELRQAFALGPRGRPRFDLVLLGMGADGHTASLFPHTPALRETRVLVTVGQAPVWPHQRLTLTLPTLNRAGSVLFLVAGADKGAALAQVFHPDPGQPALPASLVHPTRGRLLWLLDEPAAEFAGLAWAG